MNIKELLEKEIPEHETYNLIERTYIKKWFKKQPKVYNPWNSTRTHLRIGHPATDWHEYITLKFPNTKFSNNTFTVLVDDVTEPLKGRYKTRLYNITRKNQFDNRELINIHEYLKSQIIHTHDVVITKSGNRYHLEPVQRDLDMWELLVLQEPYKVEVHTLPDELIRNVPYMVEAAEQGDPYDYKEWGDPRRYYGNDLT